MVWEDMNTLFINIWNVGDREPVQSCPALEVMVWEVRNVISWCPYPYLKIVPTDMEFIFRKLYLDLVQFYI